MTWNFVLVGRTAKYTRQDKRNLYVYMCVIWPSVFSHRTHGKWKIGLAASPRFAPQSPESWVSFGTKLFYENWTFVR